MNIKLPEDKIRRHKAFYWEIEGCDTLIGECQCGKIHKESDWKQSFWDEPTRIDNLIYLQENFNYDLKKYYNTKSNVRLKIGTRVIFTRMMDSPPNEEAPAYLYCYEGSGGIITHEPESYSKFHSVK